MKRLLTLWLAFTLLGTLGCRRKPKVQATRASGSFQRLGPLVDGRWSPRAVGLTSGLVLITSGTYFAQDPDSDASGTTELFDPRTEQFYALPPFKVPRISHALLALPDGDALVVGGWSKGKLLRTLERFRTATGTYEDLPGTLTVPRAEPRLVLLPNHRVLVVGGRSKDGKPVDVLETIDLASGNVWAHGTLKVPRMGGFSAHALPDGTVLVIGGDSAQNQGVATVERIQPQKGVSQELPPLRDPRTHHGSVDLGEGRILVAGGESADPRTGSRQILATAELFDPTQGRFRPVGNLETARTRAAWTKLKDGRALVCGGSNTHTTFSTVEAFDPKRAAFAPEAPMQFLRSDDVAICLQDGRVLVLGSGLEVAELRR